MSSHFCNVELRLFDEASFTCRTFGNTLNLDVNSSKLIFFRKRSDVVKEINLGPNTRVHKISNKTAVVSIKKDGNSGSITSYLIGFDSAKDVAIFVSSIDLLESGCASRNSDLGISSFDMRTDSWSAVQYFQFYSYLSQQQNMMQDFIRTSTYQRAILANSSIDFRDKIVLDVGAGSGILSFFAIQAGATRVYAVEASNMASHCNTLVQANKLAGRIVVVSGKIEEISLPEPVDVIISEPMGYMLYNERMLESYVHARKFLAPHLRQPVKLKRSNRKKNHMPSRHENRMVDDSERNDQLSDELRPSSESDQSDEMFADDSDSNNNIEVDDQEQPKLTNKAFTRPGIMFPTVANLYIVPFSDEALFAEQHAKANFWYQDYFHGMDLTSLRDAAVSEYFNQPIVDTFDVGICPALPCVHKVDFRTISESELASIDIPLHYQVTTCCMIHGLAFWFDVGFLGSQQDVWLSTAPTEPLTHWYQVRCLLSSPIFVREGQSLDGRVMMQANSRQSYDVQIELIVPGSENKVTNHLDLKNPHFRYNGYPPAPPPGSHNRSPTENYYAYLCLKQQQQQQQPTQGQAPSNPVAVAANPVGVALDNNTLYAMTQATINPSTLVATGPNANLFHMNAVSIGTEQSQPQQNLMTSQINQVMNLQSQTNMVSNSLDLMSSNVPGQHAAAAAAANLLLSKAPQLSPNITIPAVPASGPMDSSTTVVGGAPGTPIDSFGDFGTQPESGQSRFSFPVGPPSNGWRQGTFNS